MLAALGWIGGSVPCWPPVNRSQTHNAFVGWFTNRALAVLVAVIALAILITALYAMFPRTQCAGGTSPAAGCAIAPMI
jgi:hypothetical protein